MTDVPTVTIGGKQFPVPELGPRQLRKIRAALIELNNRTQAIKTGDDLVLSDEDYDRLLLKPVFTALTRGTPALTEDEFLDLPAKEGELMAAWYTVRRQSGVFVAIAETAASTDDARGASGPNAAAADQTSRTGTN